MVQSRLSKVALAAASVALCVLAARSAAADDDADEANGRSGGFHPRFVGDARALFLIRTDNNYFGHANAYSYPVDPAATGVQLNIGTEILPRLSLLVSGDYAIDGADRDSARLRLQSAAALGMVRWAFYRVGDASAHFDASLQGGFGRYFIKETYLDPALSSQTYEQDDAAWGGTAGVQASFVASGMMAVIGYGFHYGPATISDRINGTVQAGGQEISLGLGVWL